MAYGIEDKNKKHRLTLIKKYKTCRILSRKWTHLHISAIE